MATRRNAYCPYRKPAPKGFNASALQFKRAYKAQFGRTMEQNGINSYADAGLKIVEVLGWEAAQDFVQSQSNDVA